MWRSDIVGKRTVVGPPFPENEARRIQAEAEEDEGQHREEDSNDDDPVCNRLWVLKIWHDAIGRRGCADRASVCRAHVASARDVPVAARLSWRVC